MKIVDDGHHYVLDSMDGTIPQSVQFINKEKVDDKFVTVYDGTTNEEVLKMLIDRMYWLQSRASCRENAICITKLEEALMWLEKRTRDRVARGVEGTPEK